MKGTWAGIDPILKWLDDTKPIPSIPVCRFSHPTFSQLITEYVVAHVINSERGFGKKMLDAQIKQEWLVNQTPITDHRGLNELKIGILGVGQMGQCIAKTFKVILNQAVVKQFPLSSPFYLCNRNMTYLFLFF